MRIVQWMATLGLVLAAALPGGQTAMAAGEDWSTHQHTPDRAGAAAVGQTFSGVQLAWSSGGLDGAVYAEPLYVGGHVLVATEKNTVYAFDATGGGLLWQTHLADPVAASSLPCGNIRPTVGITGSPVVDTSANVLYAAAMVSGPAYELYAVDLSSGTVTFHRPLNPPGLDAPSAGERGALALDQGRVYVPFGGRLGDCGSYHGQVVAASATDPNAPLLAYTTPAHQAGIWAPGGVATSDDGTLYVATGNGDADGPEGRTETVLALSPALDEVDVWQPGNWLALDRGDVDIGSVSPTLLQDLGLIFQSGKNGTGYLLKTGALGGVGGEAASAPLPAGCGAVFGATAYAASMLYLPCRSRVVALQVTGSPPAFSLAWSGPDEMGAPVVGSPILVAGAVWDVDLAGRLLALDAATGAVRFQTDLPAKPVHFAPLAFGNGQVYVATGDGVLAYQLQGLSAPPG